MNKNNYYDIISSNYDELHGEEQRKKISEIQKALDDFNVKIPKNAFSLDVGCGSGISMFLENCIGIDPSIELLKIAKNIRKLKVACAHAENIPFENNTFDFVISLTAIQNFSNIEKGIKEIKRVGQNNFILSVLNRSNTSIEAKKIILDEFKDLKIRYFEDDKDLFFIITN